MSARIALAALALMQAPSLGAQENGDTPWVCVPAPERGWLCGRGHAAPAQTPLPEPPPPSPPPPGYTAPPDPAQLPSYLRGVAPVAAEETAAAESTADSVPDTDRPGEPGAATEDAARPVADAGTDAGESAPSPGSGASGRVYGIQLIAVREADSLDRFVAEHGLDESRVYRRRWRDDEGAWHVLISGRFGSASEALQAIAKLPPSVGDSGAWVRRVDTLEGGDGE